MTGASPKNTLVFPACVLNIYGIVFADYFQYYNITNGDVKMGIAFQHNSQFISIDVDLLDWICLRILKVEQPCQTGGFCKSKFD
jgi:hypothetical protein